jgi:hypothetical protein
MTAPQDSLEPDTQWELKKILYAHRSGKWSLAEVTRKDKNEEQVAYRWNEDNDYGRKGTWFILPKLLADSFLLTILPE